MVVVVDYHHPQSHWNWRRRNQKGQDQGYYFEVTVVVFVDPVHSVLLSADYVHPKPVTTKLEKGVEFAELQGALDVHAPLLVAALEKVSAGMTPLFAMLVVAPHELFDDVAPVVATSLVEAPVAFDAPIVVAVGQTVFDSPILVFVPALVAPVIGDDAPFLAFASAPAVTAFDHDTLAVDALVTAAVIVAMSWNVLALGPAELANTSGLLPHVENVEH